VLAAIAAISDAIVWGQSYCAASFVLVLGVST